MVAAAIAGSALVSAGVGAATSSSAAGKQVGAANNATQAQTQLSQEALDLVQSNNAPYRAAGQSALTQLSSMLGLALPSSATQTQDTFDPQAYLKANPDVAAAAQPGGNNGGMSPDQYAWWHYQNFGQGEGRAFTPQAGAQTSTATGNGATPFDISKTPGYQFQLQQGEQGVKNLGAAGSGVLNSGTLTGLNNYAQGQAQSYYGNYLSQLAGIAGLGQSSANNTATNGGNILTGLGNNIASNTIGAGNAQAAGQIGSANAISSGLTNASSYYGLSNLLGKSGASSSSSGDPMGAFLQSNGLVPSAGAG